MSKASTLAGFVTSIIPINNLNVGIVTGTSFYGDGIGLTGISVGIGSTENYTTSGIITAASFYGDGGGLINIGGALEPITYNPSIGQTSILPDTNIVLTFNKPITAGVGTITLRTGSAGGTIVESFDVTSSNRLTFSGGILTIDPTSNLSELTVHYVVFPAEVLKDAFNTSSNLEINDYYFTTQSFNYPLFAWGFNDYGALGQNNRTEYSSPVQIPGASWSSTSNGQAHSLATKTDGTLWTWGLNSSGQLGQNNITRYSSPVQIPGTQWSSISTGTDTSVATKTDGTLWAWGLGNNGQLGQNSTTDRSSPVQIPGTSWNLAGSYNNTFATKTDGTLWSWGYNNGGQLGQNNTTAYSSPVQIPGTSWYTINVANHTLALKQE